MTAAPTFNQIRAQVAEVLLKDPKARVFAIQSPSPWTGDRIRRHEDEAYWIVQCDSPLQMRAALQEDPAGVTYKVLVTGLAQQEIEQDILVRFARRRLFPIQPWRIVRGLFRVRGEDPRLTRHAWMADFLLEKAPPAGYPPVLSGFLDAETAWAIVLKEAAGLSGGHLDLVEILRWSAEGDGPARFRAGSEEFRKSAAEWIEAYAGPLARIVLDCAAGSEFSDALPVGLCLGVLYHEKARGKAEKAAGRIEQYTGGAPLDEDSARRWAEASIAALRFVPDERRGPLADRADRILREIKADAHAHLSPVTPLGFARRVGRFGKELSRALEAEPVAVPARLEEAQREVLEHDLARKEKRTVRRIGMAVRLLRWLAARRSAAAAPGSLREAAEAYAREGGFADRARNALRGMEADKDLAEAHAALLAKAGEAREAQNREFARLLKDWTAAGSEAAGFLPIEKVLEKVVGPLAASAPLLFLVADGMSHAVFRELLDDLIQSQWVELREEGSPGLPPVIAAIPSATENSRASLFCGRLAQGSQAEERAGFESCPALSSRSGKGLPPVLFHKDALQDAEGGGIASTVREEIAAPGRRVVGVVLNAVDDFLSRGDQVDPEWTRDYIRPLSAILTAAREAGRVVVLTSDHGHVLERRTELQAFEPGERFRSFDGKLLEGEVLLSGPRVIGSPNGKWVAAWTEGLRYCRTRKNGYHGGASPQEMVVPLAVLACPGQSVPGWEETAAWAPAWWDEAPAAAPSPPVPPPEGAKPTKPEGPQLTFDFAPPAETKAPAPAAGAAERAEALLKRFFASPVLAEQRAIAGRGQVEDESLRRLVSAMIECGGKMLTAALARRIAVPEYRMRGFLAAAQRILNVEGYLVLGRDDASDTVELNVEMLVRQFEIQG